MWDLQQKTYIGIKPPWTAPMIMMSVGVHQQAPASPAFENSICLTEQTVERIWMCHACINPSPPLIM